MRQRGFTLLEAIVALTLIAATGLALFSWVESSIQVSRRAEEQLVRDGATRLALAYLTTVNPVDRPDGEVELGPYRVEWRSAAVFPVRSAVNFRGAAGLFEVGLFDLNVDISRGREHIDTFVLRQAGYRRSAAAAGGVGG